MVLEHGQRRGGTGGGLETEREGESWTAAVVPVDQTMMGLYYPAMLPVSSPPQQLLLCVNKSAHMSRTERSQLEKQERDIILNGLRSLV